MGGKGQLEENWEVEVEVEWRWKQRVGKRLVLLGVELLNGCTEGVRSGGAGQAGEALVPVTVRQWRRVGWWRRRWESRRWKWRRWKSRLFWSGPPRSEWRVPKS